MNTTRRFVDGCTINDKNLDYEIEAAELSPCGSRREAINDKTLDYEIETSHTSRGSV